MNKKGSKNFLTSMTNCSSQWHLVSNENCSEEAAVVVEININKLVNKNNKLLEFKEILRKTQYQHY